MPIMKGTKVISTPTFFLVDEDVVLNELVQHRLQGFVGLVDQVSEQRVGVGEQLVAEHHHQVADGQVRLEM